MSMTSPADARPTSDDSPARLREPPLALLRRAMGDRPTRREKLRRLAGALLASPQFVLAGLPPPTGSPPPRLTLPETAPAALCERHAPAILAALPAARWRLLDGDAHTALLACDVVLLASGTAALEAMLAKRPMVVAYRIAPWTYRLVRWLRLMRTDRYSLPNILAGRALVPELMQEACTVPALTRAVLDLLGDASARSVQVQEFERLHRLLHGGGSEAAAAAIAERIESPAGPA